MRTSHASVGKRLTTNAYPYYHFQRGHWFTEQIVCLLSQISVILTFISRINEPIPGMFVLL